MKGPLKDTVMPLPKVNELEIVIDMGPVFVVATLALKAISTPERTIPAASVVEMAPLKFAAPVIADPVLIAPEKTVEAVTSFTFWNSRTPRGVVPPITPLKVTSPAPPAFKMSCSTPVMLSIVLLKTIWPPAPEESKVASVTTIAGPAKENPWCAVMLPK